MTLKTHHEKPNVAKLSLSRLLGRLTIGQLWAFLGSIIAVIVAAFSLGHYLGNMRHDVTSASLKILRQEHQAVIARSQFFERAFEYYRTLEDWQHSVDPNMPIWTTKYPCDEKALALSESIEALRNTIDRLRNYTDEADIGIIDPRGVRLSKAGGGLQIRFSAAGDTWSVPNRFTNLNPDVSGRPQYNPCLR